MCLANIRLKDSLNFAEIRRIQMRSTEQISLKTRNQNHARLTVELEALATGPVAVAAAPAGPPPRRRAAAARRRRRRPAQLVRLVPATRRGGVPALEGRPEQPVHLAPALGRRRRRVGLDLERRQRRRLRMVARHEQSSMRGSWRLALPVVRGKWREDGRGHDSRERRRTGGLLYRMERREAQLGCVSIVLK